MQFTPDGPDIPQELITEQERGAAIFVCGAGASMTVGLPSFRKLVATVYEQLGETWEDHIAESQIMTPGTSLSGQYDRILRILEKRLEASDVRKVRGVRRRIRSAIDNELNAKEDADLSNHLTLLELSRGDDNMPRLLTTNFDNLFEWSWRRLKGGALNSHAGPAMPRPGTSGFEGVLHLHGRIADAELKLVETDLVLTSAEFGEAYLRSGWAARYVYDLARTATLVLVGYQADDPPMRYLLEVLEADRARYPDLKAVYAFAAATSDEVDLQRELWRAKGIEPILYEITDTNDHSVLYRTLHEWRKYATSPSIWRQARLTEIVARPPKEQSASEIDEAISLLTFGNATTVLVNVSPTADWWPVLSGRIASADRSNALFCWINKRLDDPEMLRACLAHPPDDLGVFENLRIQLDFRRSKLPKYLAKAWRLFVESKILQRPKNSGGRWHVVAGQIKENKIDQSLREAAVDTVYPRIQVGQAFNRLNSPDQPMLLRHLIHVSFVANEYVATPEILEAWPKAIDEEEALFWLADRALAQALDQAKDAEYLDGIDLASHDVKDISVYASFGMETGFAPLTKLIAGIWTRIADKNPETALNLAAPWRNGQYFLQRRLYLHALNKKNIYSGDVVAAELSMLDDGTFWISDAEHEVLSLLTSRWNDLGGADRQILEKRLLDGPPRDLARTDIVVSDEDWQATSYYYTFRVLEQIRRAGGLLSESTTESLAKIVAHFPERALTLPTHEPTLPGTAFVSPRGSTEPFDGMPDDKLLAEALQAQQLDFFSTGDSWQLVCNADPRRGIRAVRAAGANDRWRDETIIPLLHATIESDELSLEEELLSLLEDMPAATMAVAFITNATRWIRRRAERNVGQPPTGKLQDFWDRLATSIESVTDEEPQNDATLEDAVNSPYGLLTLALLEWANRPPRGADAGFGVELSARLRRLITTSAAAGGHARVLLVRELSYLHNVEPALVEQTLVPLFSWSHPEAGSLWRARARAGDGPGRANLFNMLKPAFLETIRRARELPGAAIGLARQLCWVALRRQDSCGDEFNLTVQEIRSALTNAPQELLDQAAWLFSTSMGDENANDNTRGRTWRESIGPLFRSIWPLDARSLNSNVSRKLVWMSLECGDEFQDAVEAATDFIVPYNLVSVRSSMMHNQRHGDAAKNYPRVFIQLLSKIINKNNIPFDLGDVLDEWLALDPALAIDRNFILLTGLRRRGEA